MGSRRKSGESTPALCGRFHRASELIGRRWTGAIIFVLLKTRCRFATLRDAIPALLRRVTGRNGYALQDDEFWALKDVSFDVKRGETLGIIGPNGAGKSTMLKLLSRISKQTKGEITVQGRLAALIEVGAGFHHDLTGRENIYLNGTILGMRSKEIDRLFDSIVAFSELERFLDMPVKRYSSGMTVRLGFSVAAHLKPENLLIDEVLAVGDLSFQQKCFQRIADLKAQDTTIIFISHNLEAVQRLCDRVILLNEGQAVHEGDAVDTVAYYRREVLRYRRSAKEQRLIRSATGTANGIELTRVALLDASGQPSERLETGQPMRVELAYRTLRPVRNPSVAVTIERLDGLVCHEASTRHAGLAWDAWTGAGSLTLEYDELALLPNTYHVVVSVFEGHHLAPIAVVRGRLYFNVTSPQRTPALPDVPALGELLAEFKRPETSHGWLAPAGTPRAIVNRISKEIGRILDLPDVRERTQSIGYVVEASTPEEYGRILRAQIQTLTKLVQDAGLKPR